MPLIKVIRHGFVFHEMPAAPRQQQLGELPERAREREMDDDAKEKCRSSAARRGGTNFKGAAEEEESAEELVIGREDFVALSKQIDAREQSALDDEGLDMERLGTVDDAIARLRDLMAKREVGI
jgi:hypothetical protein